MLGKEKKVYNIILEKEVKKVIDQLAKKQERSASWLINNVLKQFINEQKKD